MKNPTSNIEVSIPACSIVSAPEEDARAEMRILTVFRVAKILFKDRQALCRIRNISSNGIMAETSVRLTCGDRLSIELREDRLGLTGTVMWQDGNRTGIELDERIHVAKVLHPCPAVRNVGPRAPRLAVHGGAVIRTQNGMSKVALRDISQRGVKFEHDGHFAAGLPLKILIDGYRELSGFVRWSRGGRAGVALTDIIPYQELDGESFTRWAGLTLAEDAA